MSPNLIQMTKLRLLTCALVFLPSFTVAGTTPEESQVNRQVNRQADVVRAVGLIRHFHPSDAVEEVDWNAVLGMSFELASTHQSDAEFTAELARLLGGLGSGIEHCHPASDMGSSHMVECGPNDPVTRWVHRGFGASPSTGNRPYVSRRSTSGLPQADPFLGLSSATISLPAESLHGRTLRFSATARLLKDGQAELWARVDGAEREILFSAGMEDQPIESSEWSSHAIDFEVSAEAISITLGVVAHGLAHVEFRTVDLQDVYADEGDLESLLPASASWSLISPQSPHELSAEPGENGLVIELRPLSTEKQEADIDRFMPDDVPVHARIELIDGSMLRIPLALCQGQANMDDVRREKLAARFGRPKLESLSPAELARLNVAVLWPVIRHFYPYQELVDDWSGMLRTALHESHAVTDREAHRRVLQRMLVPLIDGHVVVIDFEEYGQYDHAWLPVALQTVDGELAVTRSGDDDSVRPGDRILAIDGEPAADWIERKRGYLSGSPQWRTRQVRNNFLRGPRDASRTLVLDRDGKKFEATLVHAVDDPVVPHANASVEELADGIMYVDLTSIEPAELDQIVPSLVESRGVVFDLRGNPIGPVHELLGHLMGGPDDWEGWMRVLLARAPGGDLVEAIHTQWAMQPASPSIEAPVAFLTNESAISYSESILGLVKYHGLGTIVGSNTAGSNGNIVRLSLPGDFLVNYTGMYVIGPDGSPLQGLGIEPDIQALPTIEGLRTGSDEVLERALKWIGNQSL